MMILLALLLLVDLPRVETNVTVSGTEGLLRCHVCEKEHSFKCQNPTECPEGVQFCASIAFRIFARYYYVSKQCVRYCPTSSPNPAEERSFILLKPTPFLYVRCCVRALCNTDSPELNETEANYYRERGRASDLRSSSAWLVPLLMLSPGLAGLRLP